MKTVVFDMDGTLTKKGNDLWERITREIMGYKFDELLTEFKKERAILGHETASLNAMQKGLDNMNTSSEIVYKNAYKHCNQLIDRNQINHHIIAKLSEHSGKDDTYISTTNYAEVAFAFLDCLISRNLISSKDIKIHGTVIDFPNRIKIFNIGETKVKRISKTIDICYIDDPEGNDSALYKHAKSFVLVD